MLYTSVLGSKLQPYATHTLIIQVTM